jgi:hypothetical protein
MMNNESVFAIGSRGMNVVILVDSEFGNTACVAASLAEGLEPARCAVIRLADWDGRLPEPAAGPDLLLVGGPTMHRGMSPRLRAAVPALVRLAGSVPWAVFDTRLRGPRLITGSAAAALMKPLGTAGGQAVTGPESFLVHRPVASDGSRLPVSEVALVNGELARARDWGRMVAALVVDRRAA